MVSYLEPPVSAPVDILIKGRTDLPSEVWGLALGSPDFGGSNVNPSLPWYFRAHADETSISTKVWQATVAEPGQWGTVDELDWNEAFAGIVGFRVNQGANEPGAALIIDQVIISGPGVCDALLHDATIYGDYPITSITIGNDLNCSVNYSGDSSGEFYQDTACGTFVAIDGQVYGPEYVPGGAFNRVPFTPISQNKTSGAFDQKIVTLVGLGTTGVSLLQEDSYTEGDRSYSTSIYVSVPPGSSHDVVVYRAADCYVADSDSGVGYSFDGGVGCRSDANPARTVSWSNASDVPTQWYEADRAAVWDWIATGQPFPNTVLTESTHNTAAGLGWDLGTITTSAAVRSSLVFGDDSRPECSQTYSDYLPDGPSGETHHLTNYGRADVYRVDDGYALGHFLPRSHGPIVAQLHLPYLGPADGTGVPLPGNRLYGRDLLLSVTALRADVPMYMSSTCGAGRDVVSVNGYVLDKALEFRGSGFTTTTYWIPGSRLRTYNDDTTEPVDGGAANYISIEIDAGHSGDRYGIQVGGIEISLSASQAKPVVLLHGLFGKNAMIPMRNYLIANGAAPELVIAPNMTDYGRIETDYEIVAPLIKKLYRDSGARVTIVGHSLGGLVGRYFAARHPEMVDKVITIGTPNRGVPTIDILCAAIQVANIGCKWTAIEQIQEPWVQGSFNRIWAPYGSAQVGQYDLIHLAGLKDDGVCVPYTSFFGLRVPMYFDDPNDSCVSRVSAQWMWSHGSASIAGEFPSAAHEEEPTDPYIWAQVKCLAYETDWYVGACPYTYGAPALAPVRLAELVSKWVADAAGDPVPSQDVNRSQSLIVPGGGSTAVPLGFEGSPTAGITVYVADSAVTASFAGTSLAEESTGMGRALGATLTAPTDGSLVLTNSGSIDTTVSIVVTIETTRHLSISTSAATVNMGSPVDFSVTLIEPVEGDVVQAEIIDPAGVPTPITVTPAGSGQWTGLVTPSAGGTNMIRAWTTANGVRYAGASFDVTSGTVTLGPSFSELLRDTNDNEMADELVLTPTVTVEEAGTYQVVATIVDGSGAYVAAARGNPSTSTGWYDLTAGSHQMDLTFDGAEIYESGLAGPYHLADVSIQRLVDGDLHPEASAADMGPTQAYDYHVFEHDRVRIDAGAIVTSALDADSNGYFEGITLTGQVAVDDAGAYEVDAELVASSGVPVAAAHGEFAAVAGTNDFELFFDGASIWRSNEDGPYTLKHLLVSSKATIEVHSTLIGAAVTQPSVVTQFTPAPTSSVRSETVPSISLRGALAIPFDAWYPSGSGNVELWQRYTPEGGSAGAWTKIAEATPSPVQVALDLGAGTYEFYTIAADQATGLSEAAPTTADALTVLSPPTVPDAPTNVTATAGVARATVSWTVPTSNGLSAITGYTVTSSPPSLGCGGAGALAFTCVVTGLTNGTPYTFTVTATNGVGTSAASDPSSAVTPIPPAVPGAPTGATATAGDAQAAVSWAVPAFDGGSAITGYTVISSGGQGCTTGGALTCTVLGLTNGTSYTFTVTATNAVGTGPASTASGSVMPIGVPGAPTGVNATAGNAQATVSWTAPASNGGSAITGYTVTSSPGAKTCVTTGALNCNVTGLTNGTPYTFTVNATNVIGTGAPSVPSNSVTPIAPATVPGAPTGVNATAGNALAGVSWAVPAFDGGSAITGYTVTSSPGAKTCVTTGALNCNVTGLTNGTPYTFTVTATNIIGTGAPSVPSNSVTPYSGGATYFALAPNRLLDSRNANGFTGPLVPGVAKTFQVTDRNPSDPLKNVPANAIAVTGTLTVTAQTGAGYFALGPDLANGTPPYSTLNFPGTTDDRATGVTVKLGAGGKLSIVYWCSDGTKRAQAIFDVTGYFR